MKEKKTCAIIIGSLRKNSNSKAVAMAAAGFLPGFIISIPEIGDLPLFSEDLEANPPEQWERFRAQIREADCFLFVTPEYNRGYPACIKNALDVGSRPYGKSVWGTKPGGIIGVSPGKIGASLGVAQLRQVLSFLDVRLMCQPECYIQTDATVADGKVGDGSLKDFIKLFAESFAEYTNKYST
jgi:chromate reductase